jgi:hypothetical protein
MLKFYDVTGNRGAQRSIIDQLEEGMTLSAKIRPKVDFSRGRLIAALPDAIRPSPSLNFAETLNFPADSSYLPYIASIIKVFIADQTQAVLVHDTISSKRDEWLQNYEWRSRAVFYNDEVYWRLIGPEVSDKEVEAILGYATLFPFSAFLYMPGRQETKSVLDDADIDEVIRTLAGIIVGAFDEDSFLIWWNGRAPLPVRVESQ